jgi:hypothetical protein
MEARIPAAGHIVKPQNQIPVDDQAVIKLVPEKRK